MTTPGPVDILVLGAGWTSQFLVPLFKSEKVTYALTTTTGRIKDSCVGVYDGKDIIAFAFEPDFTDESQFLKLPSARTIIITFPLSGTGPAKKLMDMYAKTHSGVNDHNWIQLGSTSIYKEARYHDHQSDISPNTRSEAEDELLAADGAVMNLAGLWGSQRLPMNWVPRIAQTKEKLSEKTSLHLIHGEDVARACLAMHRKFCPGERWIITDKHVYDWWDLVDDWADELAKASDAPDYKTWVAELMQEQGIGILPRDKSQLGRVLDSSKFWEVMGIHPKRILSRKS